VIEDIWTMILKESKELLAQGGSRRSSRLGLLFTVGFPGVLLPAEIGRSWVESSTALFVAIWFPLFMVISLIADSFAGERERHTLETLLASRLSDRAILFGKVAAAVAYGWGLTLVILLLGLVTVNLFHGHGKLLLYPAATGFGAIGMSLLVTTLAAGAGVLVSLRAATVRQAAQTLSIGVSLLFFVPIVLAQALPIEWRRRILDALNAAQGADVLVSVALVLIGLDVALLAIAAARFKRARLSFG
jgi:ABC-2 type transport system permease protein